MRQVNVPCNTAHLVHAPVWTFWRHCAELTAGQVKSSVERANQGGDSGAADAELRGQLALRWGVADAVAGMQVGDDDRVVGRHGHPVGTVARWWPGLAVIGRAASLAGAADQSHERVGDNGQPVQIDLDAVLRMLKPEFLGQLVICRLTDRSRGVVRERVSPCTSSGVLIGSPGSGAATISPGSSS